MHIIAANAFFDKDGIFHPCDISFKTKFNRILKQEVIQKLSFYDFKMYKYGFHVWNDERLLNKGNNLTKYMARYVRHPAIANGRIVDYNKRGITFYYKDNEDKEIYITKPATGFISLLTQHIPPKQFKMIRHYGAYSRNKRRIYFK